MRDDKSLARSAPRFRRILRLVLNETVVSSLAILAVCAIASFGVTVLTWFVYRKQYEVEIGFIEYIGLVL